MDSSVNQNPPETIPQPTAPPSVSSRKKMPVVLIGVFLIVGVLALVGMYFFSQQKKPELAAKKIQMPEPTKNAVATATPAVAPTDTSLSTESLRLYIQQLLTLSDAVVTDTTIGSVTGSSGVTEGGLRCTVNGTYEGRVKNGNYYAVESSTYESDADEANCEANSMYAIYTETYWIGSDIYNKQYKDKAFEKLKPESRLITAQKPQAYLKEILAGVSKLTVIKQEKKEGSVIISAESKQSNGVNAYEFILDLKKNTIREILYTIEMKNVEDSGNDMQIKGHILIASPAEPIVFTPS